MKKQKRIFMFLIFMFIVLINMRCFAIDANSYDNKLNGAGTAGIFNAGSGIINLFQWAGAGVAVAATIILGIKYMYSSPNEKADIKSKMIPWIIGGVLIFGAISIVKLIEQFASI